LNLEDKTKFYQASTSELYGNTPAPQNEQTPFAPRSPYATAKLYAYSITDNYREAYNIFACNGILFNHEGPTRGETFVTRKITRAAAAIKLQRQNLLYLGNLDAARDWGDARDFIEGMWLIMQQKTAENFVLATGESHTVREFAENAFASLDITLEWQGSGVDEKGIDISTGNTIIQVDPRYFRPTEVDHLCGDASKAKEKLGWEPKITFKELVKDMVSSDFEFYKSHPDEIT
jgi:GDPmannose 4,6-dehydratase